MPSFLTTAISRPSPAVGLPIPPLLLTFTDNDRMKPQLGMYRLAESSGGQQAFAKECPGRRCSSRLV
jgi:hypothetical protein